MRGPAWKRIVNDVSGATMPVNLTTPSCGWLPMQARSTALACAASSTAASRATPGRIGGTGEVAFEGRMAGADVQRLLVLEGASVAGGHRCHVAGDGVGARHQARELGPVASAARRAAGSLPVASRGKASTRTMRRGRKTASMR